MEEDNEEYIVLLHIVEATGMGSCGENVVVSAILGGNKLETEAVQPSDSTIFNNNLIWETDKKSIKRMKTENLPIKIEMHTSKIIQGQDVRKFVGYILLPIRGVTMVASKKSLVIKPRWHKLIGLNTEWKPRKPELSLFLTITDKSSLVQGGILQPDPKSVTSEESVEIEPCSTADMLKSQKGLHIKLLQDEGLLQVGDAESDCDIFIVKLMFKSAQNLEHIVNSEERMNPLFRIHYNLLGTPTHCSLVPKGNGIYSIQEKIAIHFRSSLYSLNEYFNKILYVPVDVYYNDTIVGHSCFRFSNFITTTNLSEFIARYENSSLEKEGTIAVETLFDLPPTSPKPLVNYVFNLKYLSTTKIGSAEVIVDKPQVVEYIDNQAGGDNTDKPVELPPTTGVIQEEDAEDLRAVQSDSVLATTRGFEMQKQSEHIPKQARSEPFMVRSPEHLNIETLMTDKSNAKTTKDAPRTFSFNIILQTVKFSRRPEVGIWQISLAHPKADTPLTIANVELTEINSNVIDFKNLELQLLFASTTEEILNLVESESCVLNINGPRGMHATADIDNEILLVSTKEKRSGVILMESETGEKVAMTHVSVQLDDLGINFNSQIKRRPNSSTQYRPHMDENLAYKVVEELEEWKQQQQDMFLVELKRKEVNHLAMLSAEWQKRKMEQENNLAQKLEECTMLAAALEEANQQVQEKGIHQLEQERIIERVKTELEQGYSAKLFELNERARRLEVDMNHQMKLEELKCREIEMAKNLIERENEKLKIDIRKLNEKISEMKKTYLPREQLAGLFQDVRILSERLEEVQKSKIFYKDQWAKIIREVHRMKLENLQQMELQLKQCRNIGLDDFLSNEHSELLTERGELNVIKDALDFQDEHTGEQMDDVME